MASYEDFESSSAIESKRQDLKEARDHILKKAKEKYEKDERRKELAKQRGEGTWMLPSVNLRVEKEETKLKKGKKKKKDKKKKEKEKKKKKRRKSSSSSDSSSSGDEEPQWTEKSAPEKKPEPQLVKGPRLERDDWMNAPLDLFPTVTRQDMINKRKQEREELEKQKQVQEKPGEHSRELNPYWKDGGSGLPEEERSRVKPASSGFGDSGLSWLRTSYERCVQQAKEEGRSLEELAAERWGSLEKIQNMIREAESVHDCRGERSRGQTGSFKNRFMRPGESDKGQTGSLKNRFMRPGESDNGVNNTHSDRRRRSKSPSNRQRRSRSGERSRRRHSRSNSRDRNRRSRSRDRQRRSRSGSRDRKNRSRSRERRNRSRSRSSERFRDRKRTRSRSRERYRRRSRSQERSALSGSSLKGRFMKPGELTNDSSGSRSRNSTLERVPAWKKKEYHKESEPTKVEDSERDHSVRAEAHKEKTRGGGDEKTRGGRDYDKRRRRRRSSSTDSSSSDSSSDDSGSSSSEEETRKGQDSKPQQPEVKILTEKEMNELGAKILRAEMMGNQAQADKLKAQLEGAREAKNNAPAPSRSGGPSQGRQDEEEDFVTLTRTDRSGMSRPIPDREHPIEARGGKRRKKQKAETHTGKQGERTKYFDDDDKYDLKTLVEREKLGTAEDQNQMFARLAGRMTEKTNDEFQMDDAIISKANQKQSASVEEERDRARAIFEHRKMAASLEKCNFCFGNVPKHLIVAIGTKVYLCLPHNKSLTEGHCLIVPMQHTAASTALDEDVWSEIQVFRKTLTKMFADRDEDVVFMETVMRLKQFPHMCIECVPIEKEVGDMAPIYFKKAIQDSESEWSQNKKVVDLSHKDIRHAVPKGFPYFAVDFGNEGGFAHVIEDEIKFPNYFGKEIIGGMIDAEHRLWRKPPRENFDDQRKKVLRFAEMWKPHDWTQNINKTVNNSDSDSD